MVDKKKLELRAKNFWRKNQKLIVLVTAAAVVGVVLAGVNTWNYDRTTDKFSLDRPQTINNTHDASFSFPLERPALQTETNLRLEVDGVREGTELALEVNGRQVDTISSSTALVKLPTDVLERENTVTLSKTTVSVDTQRLVSASVTSRTQLQQLLFVILNFTAIVLIFSPVGYLKYTKYLRRKTMEDKFPEFLRDVVEGTRAGMSLPQAIQNAETGSYGPLDDRIEKVSAQLEWGVPFGEVLDNFAEETGSPIIRRSVDTIIQAYESGGNIQDVLESVGENIRSIKQLKEERQSQLYGEMVTGYVVYFIFIGVLIALTTYLLPNLAQASQSLGGGLNLFGTGGGSLRENISLYRSWFQRLVFIQAIFSGLIIGKLSEGELKAGLKHAAVLFATGYLAVTFFL